MCCNFFYNNKDRYSSLLNNFSDIACIYSVFSLSIFGVRLLIALCIGFTDITDIIEMLFFSLILGGISLIILSIVCRIFDYYKTKRSIYSLFCFKDFKKWYSLSPEKFVFNDNLLCLHYIHSKVVNPDNYCDSYWFNRYDITTMYPKTLWDSVLYSFFVQGIYYNLKKSNKVIAKRKALIQKQKDIIYANNETMRVMSSLQSDIDRVLKESQQIITNETQKLSELNNSI